MPDIHEAMQRPAEAYVTKPFILDDLIDKSMNLIKKEQ